MLDTIFKTAIVVMAATLCLSGRQVHADGSVMFNYQGRVKVKGNAYTGSGQFKFAILSPNKQSTLWSNNSTSVDGSEPTSGIPLEVTDGVFNVVMGSNELMDSINSSLFQNREPLKLRTWFSDGVHGFQELNPEYNLINVSLVTSESGDEDFVIYVNGATGNDNKSGLKPQHAKQTIQAAIDMLPPRINANVKIDIADGTYPESVTVYGVAVMPGKTITLVGDESWTTQSLSSHSVNLVGQNIVPSKDGSGRDFGLRFMQVNGVVIKGLGIKNFVQDAVNVESSNVDIVSCELSNCNNGLSAFSNSHVNVLESTAKNNAFNGIYYGRQSSGAITACKAENNAEVGIRANGFVTLRFLGESQSNMNSTGLLAQHNSNFVFTGRVSISNNALYALHLIFNSYTENYTNGTIRQNNGNSNQAFVKFGSSIYEF